MLYKFSEIAILHKAIISNDSEELRAAVRGTELACYEDTLKTKGTTIIIDGAASGTASLTLRTMSTIAEEIEADDQVEFKGHKYKVVSVSAVRSTAYRGAKEYLIGLH